MATGGPPMATGGLPWVVSTGTYNRALTECPRTKDFRRKSYETNVFRIKKLFDEKVPKQYCIKESRSLEVSNWSNFAINFQLQICRCRKQTATLIFSQTIRKDNAFTAFTEAPLKDLQTIYFSLLYGFAVIHTPTCIMKQGLCSWKEMLLKKMEAGELFGRTADFASM